VVAPYSLLYDNLDTSYNILDRHTIYGEYCFITNIYDVP
jgi:hypothetical protein